MTDKKDWSKKDPKIKAIIRWVISESMENQGALDRWQQEELYEMIDQQVNQAIEEFGKKVEELMVADFPLGWKIIGKTKTSQHHPDCSYPRTHKGLLCDCVGIDVVSLVTKELRQSLKLLVKKTGEKSK